jgi:hypothetical protein
MAQLLNFDNDLLERLQAQSSHEQIWLSGYLYGIAQQKNNGTAQVTA